ncbi:MAG: hypothetical protein SFU83_07240 [Meiothermus sp.]|nr:hypothetical protein [Meiothermus sp.]
MRKLPTILVMGGLLALLSGCFVVVSTPRVSDLTYATSWEVRATGQDVICDNKATNIQYQFKYSDLSDITSWREVWTGQAATSPTYDTTLTPSSPTVSVDSASKTITVSFNFTRFDGNRPSPFRVESQAITVTPVPFVPTSQTGNARMRLIFSNGLGEFQTPLIPVFSGC